VARNETRRRELTDAGLAVLAAEGARGLTHRAVDAAAGVPAGTASNYFRSREALISGLFTRIGERLAPDPAVLAALAGRAPSAELFADYIRDIVRRLTAEREVTLALFELRLEAARRPELRDVVGDWLRTNFAGDVAFNAEAGLPGGKAEVALFHYAVDGLLFDRLTTSIDAGTPTDEVVDRLVAGLLSSR
jgi:DNA-binding transcriptional regulator YbjK